MLLWELGELEAADIAAEVFGALHCDELLSVGEPFHNQCFKCGKEKPVRWHTFKYFVSYELNGYRSRQRNIPLCIKCAENETRRQQVRTVELMIKDLENGVENGRHGNTKKANAASVESIR